MKISYSRFFEGVVFFIRLPQAGRLAYPEVMFCKEKRITR